MSERLEHIATVPHEAEGNLLFTESELKPYYGLHAVTKGTDYGTPTEGTFELDGEEWTAELKPISSGLAPRDDESFQFEKVKEFNLGARPANAADDSTEQRKANFRIAPRWPGLESLGDSPNPSVPDVVGVNVDFRGSNLPLDSYPRVLRRAMDSVDINPGYFTEPHEYSNINTFERYVRINREKSQAVIGMNGTLSRIYHHVARGEGKFRELREDDRGEKGYHHQAKFDSGGAQELLSGHRLGKLVKHYHPKYARASGSSDDPLAHPKLTVCYKKAYTDGDGAPWVTGGGSVRWDDRRELERETEELLINVVSWSGLTVRADYRTFVADSHFEGVETESGLSLIDDPLPDIREEQGDVVVSSLTESIESDREVLTAMADGGARSVGALAEETDLSTRTVYRVVERLEDIIETRVGEVRFKSQYLRERASETLRTVRDALESEGDSGDAKSVWSLLVAKYGIEVDDRHGERLTLRLGEVPSGRAVSELLQELYHAWQGPERDFRTAVIEFEKDGYKQYSEGYNPT